jgi:hypothetical protein
LTEAAQDLRINTAVEAMPLKVADQIQMIYSLHPKFQVKHSTATNVTSSTLFSAGETAAQDIYITGVQLSVSKDITSTSTNSGVSTVLGGVSIYLIRILTTSLMVESGISSNLFIGVPGLKLERGSTLVITNSTNVANISCSAVIFYYTLNK